eukprot:CFRG3800T1
MLVTSVDTISYDTVTQSDVLTKCNMIGLDETASNISNKHSNARRCVSTPVTMHACKSTSTPMSTPTLVSTVKHSLTHQALTENKPWEEDLLFIEVGCGSGMLCGMLSFMYPDARVLGVDINSDRITSAAKIAADSHERKKRSSRSVSQTHARTHVSFDKTTYPRLNNDCSDKVDSNVKRDEVAKLQFVHRDVLSLEGNDDIDSWLYEILDMLGASVKPCVLVPQRDSTYGNVLNTSVSCQDTYTHACSYSHTNSIAPRASNHKVKVIVLGANLCGDLSMRTVDIYKRLRVIQSTKSQCISSIGLFLQPCCAVKSSVVPTNCRSERADTLTPSPTRTDNLANNYIPASTFKMGTRNTKHYKWCSELVSALSTPSRNNGMTIGTRDDICVRDTRELNVDLSLGNHPYVYYITATGQRNKSENEVT